MRNPDNHAPSVFIPTVTYHGSAMPNATGTPIHSFMAHNVCQNRRGEKTIRTIRGVFRHQRPSPSETTPAAKSSLVLRQSPNNPIAVHGSRNPTGPLASIAKPIAM